MLNSMEEKHHGPTKILLTHVYKNVVFGLKGLKEIAKQHNKSQMSCTARRASFSLLASAQCCDRSADGLPKRIQPSFSRRQNPTKTTHRFSKYRPSKTLRNKKVETSNTLAFSSLFLPSDFHFQPLKNPTKPPFEPK